MVRLAPILIILAIILSFVFDLAPVVMFFLFALLMLAWLNNIGRIIGRTRWYKIRNGWNYSSISILDMVLFWNRLTRKDALTFTFEINESMMWKNYDDRKDKLGGIWIDEKTSIRLGFRAVDEELYTVCSYLHIEGLPVIGKEIPYMISKNRVFQLSFRKQIIRTQGGDEKFISYWVLDESGNNILNGKIKSEKKTLGIHLPYFEDMENNVSVRVTVE